MTGQDDKLDRLGDRIDAKLDSLEGSLHSHQLEDEKRFGRIDRLLVAIIIALAAPKFGGPDVAHLTAAAFHALRS